MVEKSSHKKMMPFPLVLAAILVATTLSTDLHSLPKTTNNKVTTAPPVADCIGLRVAITDKGLKYATSIAVPLLEQELSSITIPDVPFSQDGFEGGVTAISCQQFKIGAMTLNANEAPSATVALAASGVALSCKASWTYKLKVWPHVPHGHGAVDISIGSGSAFSGTLGISNNTGVFTSLSLPACTSNVHVSNLHFSGGLSGDILNLFKSLIKKTIEKFINFIDIFKKFNNNILGKSSKVLTGPLKKHYNYSYAKGSVIAFLIFAILYKPDFQNSTLWSQRQRYNL
jgi:hypothetical protein